jgi:glycosyltransferase involved in cell wall biosynthesis
MSLETKRGGRSGLVSVIIPTYNRREYVCEAIDSALAQTYHPLEIIVVDDGSTDGTGAVLRDRYGQVIRYAYQANRGESAARNAAIRRSSGEYIALLDSDDIWAPQKLAKQVALLQRRPCVGLVSCHALPIDREGDLLSEEPMHAGKVPDPVPLRILVLDSPLFSSSVVVRRACLDEVGLFPEDIRYGEDRDFCLRVAARHDVGFVSEPLVYMRRHPGGQSGVLVSKSQAEQRLRDRLRVNERVFSAFSGDTGTLCDLKDTAQAIEYARAAFTFYLCGCCSRGAALLARAIELNASEWRSGQRAADGVAYHALELADAQGLPAVRHFIERTCRRLPPNLGVSRARFRRAVLGRFYAGSAFASYREGDRRLVRRHVARAVLNMPSLLFNGGVLSISADAFIGPRFARAGRRAFQALLLLKKG